MNFKKTIPIVIAIVLLVVIAFKYIGKGFENKKDPIWVEIEKSIDSSKFMLTDKQQELQNIFDSIHPSNRETDAFKLINNSVSYMTEWDKFLTISQKILNEKKVIIFHSAGDGSHLNIPEVALFISGNKDRIEKLNCINGLERNLYEEWVGTIEHDEFHPGRLIKLIEKCNATPNQKFVLLLVDIGKVHRQALFGSVIWENLRSFHIKKTSKKINGYDGNLAIPNNLYIISTTQSGHYNEVPLTLFDYWKLSTGTPYELEPNYEELKVYLTKNIDNPLNKSQKNDLVKKLYFFTKCNEIIKEKIGPAARIGQYTRIRALIENNKFDDATKLCISNASNYKNINTITEKDFEGVYYSLQNNGRIRNSSSIEFFIEKILQYGIFSEFSVGLLFGLFSFLQFRKMSKERKKNLNKIVDEIESTENKYLLNKINYNSANGSLLSISDRVHKMANQNKLNYSHVNYITNKIKESTKMIDFIDNLGEKSSKFKLFMKIIFVDDDITTEEYKEHLKFLKENENEVDELTFNKVKKHLIKLHYKSNLKFGRTKI